MSGRRVAGVCAVVLLVALVGCGKKSSTQPDSSPPQGSHTPYPGPFGPGGTGPGPLTKGTKDNKDDAKPDFDVMLSEL